MTRFDETIDATSTIALFQQLEQVYAVATWIDVICDNARYYRSKAVQDYIKDSRIKQLTIHHRAGAPGRRTGAGLTAPAQCRPPHRHANVPTTSVRASVGRQTSSQFGPGGSPAQRTATTSGLPFAKDAGGSHATGTALGIHAALPEGHSRRELRGPDFFVVRDVQRCPRCSWTVWLEGGRYSDLIIKLLSDETAHTDRTLKKTLYETVFRTPEYFWFSPDTGELAGFSLADGHYRLIAADARGHLPNGVLGLALGVLDGLLRFYDDTGTLVPTLPKAVLREQALFEQERALVEHERARGDRLAAQLRALGVDPNQ